MAKSKPEITVSEVLLELEQMGDPQTKKTLMRHGAREPIFGVKVGDLKKLVKRCKNNHKLAMDLYATGNSDAMYLAGLIADEKLITEEELNRWVRGAYWFYISEFTVPWVASLTPYGFKLGLEWIESDSEQIASAGWATLAYYAAVNPDEGLNVEVYRDLLGRVVRDIHQERNRVRYTMNGFVIAIGKYIRSLNDQAMETAVKIGKVEVDMNGTACKVPLATEYLQKFSDRDEIGKKRTSCRC